MKQFFKSISILILTSALYMIGWKLNIVEHPLWVQVVMVFALASLPVIGMMMNDRGIKDTECIAVLIMVAGMIMRIGYLLYTPCTLRQHDLGFFNLESGGHASYILTIMQKGQLPASNVYEFYQQPFFYLIGSAVSFVVTHILDTSSSIDLVDASRIVACVASCLVIPASDALFRICRLGSKGRIAALSFVAFSPVFYLTGGTVGPDALCTLFMVLAVLYTLKWHHDPSVKHTLLLAIIYGLGVLTKISVSVIAFFTMIVFVYKFIHAVKKRQWRPLFGKFVLFGVISLPLGLWYCVRNYILFGQSPGYVVDLGGKASTYYTGEHSILQRLFFVPLENVFNSPYVNVKDDYNAPVYYIKSSLFGEFTFDIPGFIPAILLYAAIALAVIFVAAFVWQVSQGRKNKFAYVIPAVIVLFYGSVTYFYIRYPYGCSMDYRYMGLLSVLAAVLIGNFYENSKWKLVKERRIVEGVLGCYCVSSIIMFLIVP